MPSLLIKHRIWMGFALLLALLLINASISFTGLSGTKSTINSVIEESQPLVLEAHKFNGHLAKSTSSLANYLLTKSDHQRQNYQEAMGSAGGSLELIAAMEKISNSDELATTIGNLKSQLQTFQGYEERMLTLAQNSMENEIALQFASQTINPQANQILGILSTIIMAEMEEDPDAERMKWLSIMQDVRYSFQRTVSDVRIYLTRPQVSIKENMLASYEQTLNKFNTFSQYEGLYNFEQEDGVGALKALFKQYPKDMQTMIVKNESKSRRMDAFLLDTEILPLIRDMQEGIDTLVKNETNIMKQSSQALLEDVDTGLTVQMSLAAIGLVLGVFVAFVISKMVTVPLNQTVKALQDVARGEGDLTRRLEVKSKDEFGDLAEAFNQFSIKLQSLMQDVSSCSSQLITSSVEMGQVVSSTQTDIGTQNQQIDEIVEGIESMALKVQNVAGHTSEAAQLAEQTNQNAVEGRNIVNRSLESSNQLAQDVDRASRVINELESDVESISGVLDVIRGIADQTNLLALNAAIEAARAGEQGRGFAVVADEVRTLASRTQESTEEIQSMIQRLQSGSGNAVSVMDDGKNKAKQGLEHARLAGESLEKISLAVEGMLGMNREIAMATDEQGHSASQMNQNATAISELSGQTAHSSDVTAKSSQQVSVLAKQLQGLIGQFKV